MTDSKKSNDARVAERFKVALTEFLAAAKDGRATIEQRSALARARAGAEKLPDALYIAAVKQSFLEAGYDKLN